MQENVNRLKFNLSWVFNDKKIESITDLNIPSDVQTLLLYNTNDLYLNEDQFNALMECVDPTEKLYIFQIDSDEIHEFDSPMSYGEYQLLDLFSMTCLTSDKFDWVVIVDENLESGVGVFAAKSGIIERYTARYKDSLSDVQNLIAFHYRDALRNSHSFENLIKILALWHGRTKENV